MTVSKDQGKLIAEIARKCKEMAVLLKQLHAKNRACCNADEVARWLRAYAKRMKL